MLYTHLGDFDDVFEDQNFFLLCLSMKGGIDFLVSPLALVAYLSPLRHQAVINLSQRLRKLRVEEGQEPDLPEYDFDTWEFEWDGLRRQKLAKYGLLAIADLIVCITTILPLYITQYRFQPVREIILKEKRGFKELSLVAVQAALLVVDAIILLPLLPILFVTRVRWRPVQEQLRYDVWNDRRESFYLYVYTLYQILLLCFDLALSVPIGFILFITRYRRITLCG